MELPLTSDSTNEAAIHRLVDDILAYIFLLNATLPDPDYREHATTVASSQVCMRWRSIALHCHKIWGPIIDYSLHSLKWIETLVDRSHPSPLDFGSRTNSVYLMDGGQSVLELVFNHIDRLRMFNLEVLAPSCQWEFVCSRFLQLPAPNLEFVKIFIISNTRQLTHPLFDHHAPNLQNLQLCRCTVDFTSPILTHLTELYVHDISYASAAPTVLDWLNILGGMPSLRWVALICAISSATSPTTNVIYPIIHLAALDMLSVDGAFHESVTLLEHLIAPPRCGLRLRCDRAHVGFDQQQLWAIIEKKLDSWTKNATNRYLEAWSTQNAVAIGNLDRGNEIQWGTEAEVVRNKQHIHLLDPVMIITLYLSNPQDNAPLFLSLFALFERTFFDTKYLKLSIYNEPDDGLEVFLPLFDSFRGFVNLEEMYLRLVHDSLLKFLFPLLQRSLPNSVLLPALQSLRFRFCDVAFRRTNQLLRVADFLRWRGEQGFPVQKINIVQSQINRQLERILTHIRDTVVEIDISVSNSEDEE
jgi:hypothetical protein